MIAAPPKKLDLDNDGRCLRSEECCFEAVRQARPRSDGTLDKRELRGRLNAKDFAAGDPDNDGTLDKNEFLALIEKRFKAADPDNSRLTLRSSRVPRAVPSHYS
jgi:hypothetical protein